MAVLARPGRTGNRHPRTLLVTRSGWRRNRTYGWSPDDDHLWVHDQVLGAHTERTSTAAIPKLVTPSGVGSPAERALGVPRDALTGCERRLVADLGQDEPPAVGKTDVDGPVAKRGGRLVLPVVRELHGEVVLLFLDQRLDGLEIVAALAADPQLVALDLGLDPLRPPVADEL
jgi:hypothetical protein